MRRLKRDPLERAFFCADINMALVVNPVSFALLLYRRYAKPGSMAGEKDAATTGTV